ncbi:non-ribosomal peptide synthetase/type I polyketide synthase [Kribbella alba]|uniref:non-ribosomal peptide synthetase/type I polyketide synthase n=1 Tax=Kribbella alba TaxID=190197 RepID=UPI0031DCCE0E
MRNGVDRPAISTGPALMIPAGYPRDLPSALLRAARDFGSSGVVEIGPDGRETRLDFPTLLELAARILAGLRANGVRAGDPAVVHCTEPVGFFAAFWACTLGGIRPLLMAPAAEGDTTEEGRERLRKVTDLLGWTVLIGRPSDLPNDLGLPVLDPDALAGHEPTSEFHRPAADDVAVLMMSSGSSTGTPKIIQLTHRGLVEFAAGTPAMLPVRPGQTTLNWLPLDHSGAFLLYHLLPVFTGCTNIHVATDWVLSNPLRWLDLMDQHRVNHSWSPNFGYRLATAAIAGEPDRHWDLSALRSLVSGGEQITVPVVSDFLRVTNRFGVVPETFVAAWGMTETVTGITFARPGLTPNVHRVRIPPTGVVEWVDQRTTAGKVAVARPGKSRVDGAGVLSLVSVGTPAPGATVRIVGSNGAVLPEGRIGQLQIASARVTPGYLGNPDADRAAFPAGNWPARKWLATGDQAFITGGQVVITGRDSERIILSGQNYSAHDIETVAASVEGAELGLVAACGTADAAAGTERLVVFYALTEDSPAGVDQAIRAVLQDRLALQTQVVGVPRRHFPTTPGGKILRPLLKQRWIDGTLESPTHPQTRPQPTIHPGPQPGSRPPVVSPYGDPVRAGTFDSRRRPGYDGSAAGVDDADGSAGSERAGGRADFEQAEARAEFDEDAGERTTELPAVRLAWRRSITDSIPVPPARPTLGANRDTNSDPADLLADPTHEAPADDESNADPTRDPKPTHLDPSDAESADLPAGNADPADVHAGDGESGEVRAGDAESAELPADELTPADPLADDVTPADPLADDVTSSDGVADAESTELLARAEMSTDPLVAQPTPPAPSQADPIPAESDAARPEVDVAGTGTDAAQPEPTTAPPQAGARTFSALVFDEIVFDEAAFSGRPQIEDETTSADTPTDGLPADEQHAAEKAPNAAPTQDKPAADPDAASEPVDASEPEVVAGPGVVAEREVVAGLDGAAQQEADVDRAAVDTDHRADYSVERDAANAGAVNATPPIADPADADPADADPAEVDPAASADADPADVDADAETNPADTDSADADPTVVDATDVDPAEAGADPAGADLADSDRAGADPADADRAGADHGESEDAQVADVDLVESDAARGELTEAPQASGVESAGSQSAELESVDRALAESGAAKGAEPATAQTSQNAELEPAARTDVEEASEDDVDLTEPSTAVVMSDAKAAPADAVGADLVGEGEDAPTEPSTGVATSGGQAVPAEAVGAELVAEDEGARAEAVDPELAAGVGQKRAAEVEASDAAPATGTESAETESAEVVAAEGRSAAGEAGGASHEVAARVLAVVRGVVGGEVDEGSALHELGVDSVAVVRVHTRLQEELGLEFPRAVMFEHESIFALGNYLQQHAAEFRRAAAHSTETPAPEKARPGKKAKQAIEPIAIIGLAARFPGADTLEQFWDNLVGGVESIRRFSSDELGATKDAFGNDELVAVSGALDDVETFDADFFGLSAREAELTDPAQRIFLEVCQHALEHGGHAGATGRIGIFAGSGMNLYSHHNQPPDFLATRVAYRLGLTGPAIGVQAAWSSSLVAVHLACQALRSGDADLALAGAAAVHVPQATGYHPTPGSILSPSGQVRAFDAEADGTVGGNGVAAVLLKRLDQAVADGDTVYAVIRGSAVSNESNQADLVERALEKAGVPADSLSYIEANATGTAADDASEFRAMASVLRRHTDKVGFCTIGSVKPNIGHLDSAAGMAGLIKTVLMLQHRTLVPTINFAQPNPELPLPNSPLVIGTEVRDWEAGTPLRAGVSALDAGGTSAHVILEEAPRQIRRGDDGPVVLPLSAPDPAALEELVELFRIDLDHGTGHRLIDLAGTAALGRPAYRHRLAVTGSSETELAGALGTAQAAEVPRGGPGPLGFAFTGQGAARRGMAAGLATRFPVFRSVLDECDKVYAEEFGGSLLELLLTPAGSSEGVWPTETAQPALFAFELALARLWQSFGVQPALVVGHSVGEYAALCVAGALSLADGVRLTAKRGQLMQRGTVPGAMVAVRADADRVRELARTSGVEIAAGNGPQSFVLTGTEVIVGQLAEQLDRLELKWQRLDVDRAFHSSLVDPILADFAEVVAEITLRPLRMPMVSSWSGELLESGTALDADYLVGQLRQPVLFGDAVEALTAAGCRRFLELGPDAVLSPAGRRIAPNSTWIPTQRLGQDPVQATMNGLAELYEQGTEIAWKRVYPDGGRVPLPVYPFRRVHHPVDTSSSAGGGAAATASAAAASGTARATSAAGTARVTAASGAVRGTAPSGTAQTGSPAAGVAGSSRPAGPAGAGGAAGSAGASGAASVTPAPGDAGAASRTAAAAAASRTADAGVAGGGSAAGAHGVAAGRSAARVQPAGAGERPVERRRPTLKRIPLDPPAPDDVAHPDPAAAELAEAAEHSPFTIPAESSDQAHPDTIHRRPVEPPATETDAAEAKPDAAPVAGAAEVAADPVEPALDAVEPALDAAEPKAAGPEADAPELAPDAAEPAPGDAESQAAGPEADAAEPAPDDAEPEAAGPEADAVEPAPDDAEPEAAGPEADAAEPALSAAESAPSAAEPELGPGSGEDVAQDEAGAARRGEGASEGAEAAGDGGGEAQTAGVDSTRVEAGDAGVVGGEVGDPAVVAARYRASLEVVLDLTGEQLGLDPYDVTVDHTFAELGADSLSMLRVVEEVGQRFDVELAVSELFDELNTPHKLASAVASRNLPGGAVDPLDLLRSANNAGADGSGAPERPAETVPDATVEHAPGFVEPVRLKGSRQTLAVLGSGLAELAAKVDAAAAATSEADLPGSGMAALMSQQLRVAGQLVDGVTKLMHEQLALLNETTHAAANIETPAEPTTEAPGQSTTEAPARPTTEIPAARPAEVSAARSAEASAASTAGVPPETPTEGEEAAKEKAKAQDKRAKDLEYWRQVLVGAQPLVLPTDRPRPAARAKVASTVRELDQELGDAVFAFSRDRRVSPLMTMLAAVGTVLGRFAAQDDITVGTAALRRPGDESSQFRPLPLRLDLSGEPDLGELAQRVRETTTAAFDHATAELGVLEQDPLFQVLVEFEAGDDDLTPDLDLRLRLAHHAGGIRCTADYRAGLFDAVTIDRLLRYIEAVLRRATAETGLKLPELMLPTPEDQQALRDLEGEPAEAGPIGRVRRDAVVAGELSGLHTLFEQQVARTPDAIALIQGERELTYAELNRRANVVAWQLVDLGVKPGQLVAVRVARGTELVVGVLAVLKSGAAYLPLDPGVPESRWSFMTADSGAVALVGDDAALADRLGLRLVPVAAVEGDPRAGQAPPVRAAADDIAYCIYTSGSTGNPKGVAVPHRGPVNLVRQYLRTRRSLRTLQWTSFGFDVHVQEMFTALASGAALVLIGEDDRYDPDEVVAALTEHQVERLFMTFTPLTALLATMPEMPKLPALREIVAGGEAMVLSHGIRDFLAAHPDCALYNEYGPTEASIVATIHQVDPAEDRPSIGRPIDGVVVRVLDEALRAVPVGAVGEIHIGGAAVAQGYLGRPDETETAFVNDPAHPGGRLYRSRDLARWRTDGTLDYLGRVDDQVKIRGHRVEPGETEHVLADLPGVIDAVVVACTDPAGDTCLIGYVVLEDDDPAVLARLLLELTQELPIYLVPADLIPIDDLPLDASGKLDRARLPEPEWLKE